MPKILVINPGSTSTKISVFENEQEISSINLGHDNSEISRFANLMDQKDFRIKAIESYVQGLGINFSEFDAFVGRGGLMRPIPGGTYEVDQQMIDDLTSSRYGAHASNLGAIIVDDFAKANNKHAYIVDPVVVDEFEPVAYLSGLKDFERRSVFHALNQKAVAREALKRINKDYESGNVIVAHLGGGISIGAHQNGKVIDVNNGLDGEGPFSPTRSGQVSLLSMVNYIYEQKPEKEKVIELITQKGGLISYLDTNDLRDVQSRIEQGNQEAQLVFDGLIYQIAKEIGAQATVLNGKVDVIAVTGGLAFSKPLMKALSQKIEWISEIVAIPGEMEMAALNLGGQRVLSGAEAAKNYKKESEVLANGKRI